MNKWHYLAITGMMSSLLSACSGVDSMRVFDHQQAAALLQQMHTMKPAQQMIALSLPHKRDWQRIDLSHHTIGTPLMLIPRGQTMNDWHESIRTQIRGYAAYPNITPDAFIQQQQSYAKSHCRLAEATILNQTTESVLYRLRLAGCDDIKDQQQMGKVFRGKDAVYVVYYTAINGQFNETHWDNLTSTIKTARLIDSVYR